VKILNSLLLISTGCLFATLLYAAPSPRHENGFYVGGSIGATQLTVNTKVTGNLGGTISSDRDIALDGITGGILGGYSWYIGNHGYLAVEANANLDSANTTIKETSSGGVPSSQSKIHMKMTSSFALSFIPGYFVNDNTVIFGRLGFAAARLASSATNGNLNGSGADFTKTVSGYRLGLGLTTELPNNFTLTGEYDYTDYSSFKKSSRSAFYNNTLLTTNYAPSTQQFVFSVAYHFNQF